MFLSLKIHELEQKIHTCVNYRVQSLKFKIFSLKSLLKTNNLFENYFLKS